MCALNRCWLCAITPKLHLTLYYMLVFITIYYSITRILLLLWQKKALAINQAIVNRWRPVDYSLQPHPSINDVDTCTYIILTTVGAYRPMVDCPGGILEYFSLGHFIVVHHVQILDTYIFVKNICDSLLTMFVLFFSKTEEKFFKIAFKIPTYFKKIFSWIPSGFQSEFTNNIEHLNILNFKLFSPQQLI